ncbi:MAG: histidine kinase [Candidatus Nanopelagicales bacterium]
MKRKTWLIGLTFLVTVAWTWFAARQLTRYGHPPGFVLTEVAVACILVGSGLLIWRRRIGNRCGWLLVAAGLAWPVGALVRSTDQNLQLVGFAFSGWYDFFLAWALLAYPTGRLRGRIDMALLVALGVLFSARTLSRLFLHVAPDVTGCGCIENRFLPITDDRYWRAVESSFKWGLTIGIGLVLARCVHRWWSSSKPGKRTMTPALVAAVVLLFSVLYEAAAGWNSLFASVPALRTFTVEGWAHAAVAVTLVVGFLRLDYTRSAVVDLVGELGRHLPPAQLNTALQRVLGDPGLRLVFWSADADKFVDDGGAPVELPGPSSSRAVTIIERDGSHRAALIHDAALLEDPGVVGAVTAAIQLTGDNATLMAENERQLKELAASRSRIVKTADAERRRIERDLHDGAQQRLVTIALSLRLAEARLDPAADAGVRSAIEDAVEGLSEAIDDLRDLARGIHPSVLAEAGLARALESLADRSSVDVVLHVEVPRDLPADVATAAYFSVAEALTNVAKHSGSNHAVITGFVKEDQLQICVVDEGSGGAELGGGSGLTGLSDRIAAAGGVLMVVSPAGAGTRIEVSLPCELL